MTKKTAIITGGSSGLGFELVKILLNKNIGVINLSKTEPKIENKNLFHIYTNLNCNKSLQRTINNLNENHKKIDYLFLNAGIWKFEMIEEINFKKVDEIMKTNLSSNIKLVSGIFENLRKNKTHIIVSGSINSTKPEINQLSYNISKAAMQGFAKSLELEFENKNKINYLELQDFESNLVPVNENVKLTSAQNVANKINSIIFEQ